MQCVIGSIANKCRPSAYRTFRGAGRSRCFSALTADEKYLFDLQGFLILRGVIDPEDVANANSAIDRYDSSFVERSHDIKNAKEAPFRGSKTAGRLEHGTFLEWPLTCSAPFRKMLAHPNIAPKLHDLVGEGYRLDHMPLILRFRPGVEGFDLHGGAIGHSGVWNRELSYEFRDGRMYCNLLALSVQLSDTHAGEGGFTIVPGSHKANFACPRSVQSGRDYTELLQTPELKAGDAVIFSEATTHGARPWMGDRERRIALYRFAPATFAYGRGYLAGWSDEAIASMTSAEKAVLEPPYSTRLDRPVVHDASTVTPSPRAKSKCDFDQAVFSRPYF